MRSMCAAALPQITGDSRRMRNVLGVLCNDTSVHVRGKARMNDSIRQAGQFVQGALQEVVRQRGDEKHREGFTRAAGISLHLVQDEIDLLKEQMKGPGLSKSEQALYAHLEELKAKIESGFDRYWKGTGVDWRPPTPIAKGILRQTGESQPS
jgi:hypothetical protein